MIATQYSLPIRRLRSSPGNLSFLLLPGLLLAVTGCTFLPSAGPSAARISKVAKAEKEPSPYRLIPITTGVINTLREHGHSDRTDSLETLVAAASPVADGKHRSVSGVNRLPSAATQRIAVGDVVNVTIYETGGTLFGSFNPKDTSASAAPSNALPPQTVDASGSITVPYAGRIAVTKRSPYEVEADIIEKLKAKAIDPQVIVTISDRKGGNLVTVTGDVKAPAQVPLGFGGTRLLDAVTAAGGSIGKPEETLITVMRGHMERADLLVDILNNSAKNVPLQAGDTIVVKSEPRTYITLGATGKPGKFPFAVTQVSLAEALADSGGAVDTRSNPAAIYVYRKEPTSLVRELGSTPTVASWRGVTPVIYNLNLVAPDGLFLARDFKVQDKDIIFFADAGSVGLQKFLSLLGSVTSGATSEFSAAARVGGE